MKPERFSSEWWQERTSPEPNTGCLLWLGSADKDGYCRVAMPGKSPQLVHRVAYEQFVGPIPDGMKVCHRCDTPSCVNADHFFLGTQKANLRDMFRKRRGAPQGRPMGEAHILVREAVVRNPSITASELARELGVTRQRIYQIAKDEGIRFAGRRQ